MGFFSRFRKDTVATKSFSTFEVLPLLSMTPHWRDFSRQMATHSFERSTWLYACIRLRAVNLASVPMVAERRVGDDEWEPVDNELQTMLRRPNPQWDWTMLMRRAAMLLDLPGDAFFTKVRNGAGAVRQLWPIVPTQVQLKQSSDGISYRFQFEGGATRTVPAEDVVHLKYAHPTDMFFGLSPLQAAARAVDIDEQAETWQKTSLENLGVPPFGVTTEGAMSQEEFEDLKRWVREQTGPENARRPWVLGNAKIQDIAQSAVDLDFVNARKLTREEICAAYSVPPPLVGIYENATLANIETARQILWREGLIPVLDEITAQLTLQLASEFGDDLRINYDLSNVEALRENMGEKLEDARRLWDMGTPLSVLNAHFELGLETDDIPGADVGYVPSGLFPAGEDFDVDETPGGDDVADEAFGSGGDANTRSGDGGKVQDAALNGAQIQALQSIAAAVANGELPFESAVQIIRVSFPTIDENRARAIVEPMIDFTPRSENGADTE